MLTRSQKPVTDITGAVAVRHRRGWVPGSVALLIAAFVSPLGTRAAIGQTDPQVSQGLGEFARGRFAEAIGEWRQAADAGSATAALYLGVTFDTGQGVPQSDVEAMQWYKRAAASGNASAMFNVGVLFDSGHGVPVDRAQAARWYAMAAERGFPRAEYNLGLLYEAGDGVAADSRRATALFRAAAGHGVTAARGHLARLGQPFAGAVRTVQPDPAMTDFARAQQLLLGHGTTEAVTAAELFRQAALQHNALAAYDYAYCLDAGLGVQEDKAMAFVWYERAAQYTSDDSTRALAAAGAEAIKPRLTASQALVASRALPGVR